MFHDRRAFLKTLGAGAAGVFLLAEPYRTLAQSLQKKIKITDVKCMSIRGTWDWNLVKIETDSGLYGIGEAYWGGGIKDLILRQLKPALIGQDPMNVDKLYTSMLLRSEGSGALGGQTVSAAAGIEIALWDLVGRILQTPVCNLLGGRFRDKVRFYRTMQLPKGNIADPQAWRDQVAEARAEKWKWTAFKFQGDGIPGRLDPRNLIPGHDPFTRSLNPGDIREIAKCMDTVRDSLGQDIPFRHRFSLALRFRTPFCSARRSNISTSCGWKIRFLPSILKSWASWRAPPPLPSARAKTFMESQDFCRSLNQPGLPECTSTFPS